MIGNVPQCLGKAKNISLIDFNTIDQYESWANRYPQYIIYDIKIVTKTDSVYSYAIVVVYLKVNE